MPGSMDGSDWRPASGTGGRRCISSSRRARPGP
jgi:hypothetical protein